MDKDKLVRIVDKQVKTVFKGATVSKQADGERLIRFVASSNKEDRHYESVDVASLRLPLKDGGVAVAGAIGADGLDMIDIPLMLNHSGDVRDVIGSVRKAYFENGELIFECGISERDLAQEMLKLLEEGHLSNAFSITMVDYDYNFESEIISNAEVLEVSLVYRGANREARLVSIKSLLNGENMDKKSAKTTETDVLNETKQKQNDTFGDANGDGQEHGNVESETTQEVNNPVENEAGNQTPEENKNPETETNSNNEEEKEKSMNKEIAKDTVEKATRPVQASKADSYLKTKAALADFKEIVLKHHKGSNEQIMREWTENLKSKGLTGDALMPAKIENIFFKAWVDNPGILGTFRMLGVKNASVYAMTTDDTAQGHKKGDKKDDQTLEAIRRDLKGLGIYKKLPIDLQDLYDDETGELLAFRVEELAARVANAIAIGALIGQGTGDKATKQGGRGLYPMLTDINASTGFGSKVATKVTGQAGEGSYELAVRAISAVKDERNAGKILVVPTGFAAELKLAKGSDGHLLLPIGADLAGVLGVKQIFEIDELVGKDVKAIAYANQSYVLVGQASATVRTDFDLSTNTDIALVERYVGGSQQGYKTLAGAFSA